MKALLWIVIIALLVWGGYALFRNDTDNLPPTTDNQGQVGENPAGGIELARREFTVIGKPFSFTPSTLEVNEGEMVRITFVNEEGSHDLVVDGYNARTKVLQAGQSETIEFLADKSGSFEFYCSVDSHKAQGMKGTLMVNVIPQQ